MARKKSPSGLPVYTSSEFTWKGGEGAIELSAMGDEYNLGSFIVHSLKNGSFVMFTLSSTDHDERENEILAWKFRSNGIRPPVFIRVFND